MSAEEILSTHQERIEAAARHELQRHLCRADVDRLPEFAPTALARLLELQRG